MRPVLGGRPVVDPVRQRELVLYRKDFGTKMGWREIRGLQVVELNRRFADIIHARDDASRDRTVVGRQHIEWYLDRLGKLERFRRQLYSVTLTPHGDGLWLGLAVVLEWAKDGSEPRGASRPAFERDTSQVYLVTSRDGVHIDDEWIYAHRPLISKRGKLQGAWDSGFLLPSAQLLTHRDEHRIYFEARDGSQHHEERFAGKNPCRIGTSAWQRGRLVGVRVADPKLNGTLLTKAFRLDGPRLLLDVDVSAAGSSVSVEVLRVDREDGTVLSGSQRQHSIPIAAPADGQTEALWLDRSADSTPFPSAAQPQPLGVAVTLGTVVALQITLVGPARVYSFEVRYPV